MALRNLLLLSSFLLVSAVTSHATSPAEEYWHRVLPNTPMPNAIKEFITPDVYADETDTSVNVGTGGVHVNTRGTNVNVGPGSVHVNTGKGGTHVNVGHGGVNVNAGKPQPDGTHVSVGKGGVGVVVGHGRKKRPVGVHVGPFQYHYAASDTQLHDDPNSALFFQEKALLPNSKITVQFTKTTNAAAFLPRPAARSLPFSSSKLPFILHHFSIPAASPEAAAMKQTIKECEDPAAAGESKHCATSLESMVEFTTATLATRNVRAVSTVATSENKQEYTVVSSTSVGDSSSELVACHAEPYAYAVFYCHKGRAARAYKVELVGGEDGAKVEAVAVCHADTAGWNPKHVAFRVLNVKPGTVPVCHFLPEDHVVWTPSNK